MATAREIKKGTFITESDLTMLSPGGGLRWQDRDKVVGGWAVHDIDGAALLTATMARH